MEKEEKIKKGEEHYVCLGDCQAVVKSPGVCQAPDCANYNHEFVRCDCTDGCHKNFNPRLF